MHTRRRVLDFVRAYPGVHGREVERRLHLTSRLANYHLDALAEEGTLQRLDAAGYTRFFPVIGHPRWSARDIRFLGLMRRPVALRIVVALLDAGETDHGSIAKVLHLPKASASYHLAMLEDAGILTARADGRHRLYSLGDEAYVRGALANFTPLPEDLESFEKVWQDLFG